MQEKLSYIISCAWSQSSFEDGCHEASNNWGDFIIKISTCAEQLNNIHKCPRLTDGNLSAITWATRLPMVVKLLWNGEYWVSNHSTYHLTQFYHCISSCLENWSAVWSSVHCEGSYHTQSAMMYENSTMFGNGEVNNMLMQCDYLLISQHTIKEAKKAEVVWTKQEGYTYRMILHTWPLKCKGPGFGFRQLSMMEDYLVHSSIAYAHRAS